MRAGGIEGHKLARRQYPCPVRLVDDRPQLAQAPAQGSLGIVRSVPQQGAEPLPPQRPVRQRQIGQQAARLPGGRQFKPFPLARYFHFAQESDAEHQFLRKDSQELQIGRRGVAAGSNGET